LIALIVIASPEINWEWKTLSDAKVPLPHPEHFRYVICNQAVYFCFIL